MPITINGTTGIAGVDGSAGTPAVQGTDTNTGVFYPAADTVAISTGGSERMRVDSSGNVGIGTSSPSQKLQVANGNIYVSTTNYVMWDTSGNYGLQSDGSSRLSFFSGSGSERARFDSSGNLLVGTTSSNGKLTVVPGTSQYSFASNAPNSSGTYYHAIFLANGVTNGAISSNGTTTSYVTSSDYRLKHDVQPISSGLSTVSALRPVTYKWQDDSYGEGFIAHELQEIIPHAVTGEKDAVDEKGNIKPQGVDYSKIVVHLVAAIQELSAKVDAQAAEIEALKANAPA